MASKLFSTDQHNFTCLGYVCVHLIKIVLRDIFETQIKPEDLYNAIQSCSELTIGSYGLWLEQLRICYVTSPDYNKFDVSVLYTLIRNLCPSLKPSQGWGKTPTTTDLNIGDDIERLILLINGMEKHLKYSAASNQKIAEQKKELNDKLQRIKAFLTSLDSDVHYDRELEIIDKTDYFGFGDLIIYKTVLKEIIRLLKGPENKEEMENADIFVDVFEHWFCGQYKEESLVHFYHGIVDQSEENVNEGDEVIVAYVKNLEGLDDKMKFRYSGKDIPIIWKLWRKDSKEPSLGMKERQELQKKYFVELQLIERHRKNATKDLFKAHSNLQMSMASTYQLKKGDIVKDPCIVLYCSCKGIVPIKEKKFPTKIKGIKTDIREGFFQLHCNLNEELCAASKHQLDSLKIGASIGKQDANSEGTLGGFVKFKDKATNEVIPSVGFITCAHNFYSSVEMETNDLPQVQLSVVQPSHLREGSEVCGETVKSISSFSNHNREEITVDASLVKLTERHPKEQLLHSDLLTEMLRNCEGYEGEKFPLSVSGTPVDIRTIDAIKSNQSKKYLKCGTVSGLTRGTLEGFTDVRPIQIRPMFNEWYDNQLQIKGVDGKNFSEEGDSGSLVFQVRDDKSGKLDCIGMIVGGARKLQSSAVTPIIAVLDALEASLYPDADSMTTLGQP